VTTVIELLPLIPDGTFALIVVEEITVNVASAWFQPGRGPEGDTENITRCAPLRFVPVIVMVSPALPEVGLKLTITGAVAA